MLPPPTYLNILFLPAVFLHPFPLLELTYLPFSCRSSARVVVAGRGGQPVQDDEDDSDDIAGFENEDEVEDSGESSEEIEEEAAGVVQKRRPLLKKSECIRLGLCHVCR
jgi:hypothetical protein